jgi:hypothetical protein
MLMAVKRVELTAAFTGEVSRELAACAEILPASNRARVIDLFIKRGLVVNKKK